MKKAKKRERKTGRKGISGEDVCKAIAIQVELRINKD